MTEWAWKGYLFFEAARRTTVRPSHDEIIDARMLVSLALIAEANDRSLVEELNLAVQAYVREQLPLCANGRSASVVAAGRVESQAPAP